MKKIITISLLFITILSSIYSCFAIKIEEKELISLGKCEDLLILQGRCYPVYYIVYEDNGEYYPAYCLDATTRGITDDFKYSIKDQGKLQDEKVWRAIINGYPYKSLESLGVANEKEAYYATRFAVYTMLYDRKIEDHVPVDSDAGRRTYNAFVQIVQNARNSSEKIENNLNLNIIPTKNSWDIDEINGDYVSKTYSLNGIIDTGNYDINIDGTLPEGALVTDLNNNIKSSFNINEQFKIMIPLNSLNENGKFDILAKAHLKTKPVVYGKSNIPETQDYAISGYMYEDFSCTLTENYLRNTTKLIVKKQEYGTAKKLSGVKFNLLNENKNIIKQDLISDDNGLIVLENMIPGKYYLQETETLDEYNLYTDLIELKLDFNEELQIVVNNTKKNITEVNKSFENIQIVETNKEKISNNENLSSVQTVFNEQNISNEKNILNENIKISKNEEVKKLPKTGF